MIVIHDYNPAWPAEFETIRATLQHALGLSALHIDHIGSTSVPGLGAKDVIDVQVTVAALTPDVCRRLVEAGFTDRPEITHDHVPLGEDADPALWSKLYLNEPPGGRRAHIHVRVEGNPNQRYALLFRDYLQAHPNSARTIELIKRRLARYHGDDVEVYYDIKDPVYDLIWDAALDWARYTGWVPQTGATMDITDYVTTEEVQRVCRELGIRDWTILTDTAVEIDEAQIIQAAVGSEALEIPTAWFRQGLEVELEHGMQFPDANVTNNHPILTGKIVLAHLKEMLDYYLRLEVAELEGDMLKAARKGDPAKLAQKYGMLIEARTKLNDWEAAQATA
jgi:GrpB-like predicted nucleotidyltransferase (UPF0157 family)